MQNAYQFDPATGKYVDTTSSAYAVAELSGKNTVKKSDALTVSDALQICKTGLESIRLKIIGEISSVNNKTGYKAVYFDIKDKSAVLPCLIWKSQYNALNVDLKVGELVEVSGKFSLYAAKGRMSFNASSITLAGEGELRMKVARLAKKLQNEGLCDAEAKLALPDFPEKIGVVTSPRGAAIHDVFRTLRRRMPIAKVVSAAVPVEGDAAPAQMIQAIDNLTQYGVDVILLVRGGGSFEDLMPFNDEALARRVAESKIPIVTGIGHEPDTTICDLVSDKRASTPTAAAETVSINSLELSIELDSKMQSAKESILNRLKSSQDFINQVASRQIFTDGTLLYQNEFQNLGFLQDRLVTSMSRFTEKYNNELGLVSSKLNDRCPSVVLTRGYSATTNKDGNIIKSINQVRANEQINVAVSDGSINCTVNSTNENKITDFNYNIQAKEH